MKKIKSIEEWNTLSEDLAEAGYRVWQMQYGIDHPEGFLSWFISTGKPERSFTTHDPCVAKAIVSYSGIQRRKVSWRDTLSCASEGLTE